MAAQDLDQFFVNDLDHLLGWRKRVQHLFADGLLLDVLDELFDNFEIDVGLEQRHADFAQGAASMFSADSFPFAAQVLENPLQLIR